MAAAAIQTASVTVIVLRMAELRTEQGGGDIAPWSNTRHRQCFLLFGLTRLQIQVLVNYRLRGKGPLTVAKVDFRYGIISGHRPLR